jgi:hypothetical protein
VSLLMGDMWKLFRVPVRTRPLLFFLMLSGYVFVIGRAGLPVAHDFFDRVVMRDVATLLPFLLSQQDTLVHIIVEAMKHLEGPLQFLVLNFYSTAVGDFFGLGPRTMQFPNTLFAVGTSVLAYLTGAKLVSVRFGYCVAMSFVLTPWLAHVVRMPVYFNLLSCLLHFSTFYYISSLVHEPQSRYFRFLAPLSLSLYFFTALDWPSYLLFLAIFITLTWSWNSILRNPFNVVPILVGIAVVAWAILLMMRFGVWGIGGSVVGYPFVRALRDTSTISGDRMLQNTLLAWGPQMILASAGAVYYLRDRRAALAYNKLERSFFDASCLWLLWAGFAVLVTSGSHEYLYVVGMPASVISGLMLSKLRDRYLVLALVLLAIYQIGWLTNWHFHGSADEKRRILAAACFLIEQRPDLLAEDKTLLAVGNCGAEGGVAGAVSQYARPNNKPVVIPVDFPVMREKVMNFPGGLASVPTLNRFVDDFVNHGLVRTQCIIMESSALTGRGPSAKCWQALGNSPQINWIARFSETGGEVYIGEVVTGSATSLAQAPMLEIKEFSNRYLEKYDRISFLKRNVQNIRLFFTSLGHSQ